MSSSGMTKRVVKDDNHLGGLKTLEAKMRKSQQDV